LFSLAAVVPAVTTAVFLGLLLTQGVEQWFSSRVETAIDNAAAIGRTYVDIATENLSGEMLAMGADLNAARGALTSDAPRYGRFLASQAERRLLTSAFVIDRRGAVLARAEESGASAFRIPSERAFQDAERGDVAIRFDENANRVRGLYKLSAYENAYLFVTRDLETGMISRLRAFETAVVAYREAEQQRARLQTLFALAYSATAALVLLGAVWLGLANATRISEPIGRLVDAARRVSSGDFNVRVEGSTRADEVGELAQTFNQMTGTLSAQRRELVAAQEDAESRSSFIQAVLAGVSAGVIGLDRDGRISAANKSAAHLLGMEEEPLGGRRLIDVAPEFAVLLNSATPQQETPPQRIDLVRENFSANLSVRMSPDPETGGFVLTFDDMTKLITAQRQEAWKDVARRIAHEIKNPLTPIQLSAERLQRKYASEITSDPEIFRRCTDTILRQVSDIGRMVDEFSSFARMPAPRMAFADMSELARSSVFSQRLVYPDIVFDAEGVDQPIGLICDERLIGQGLLNLLKNAAESIQGRRARDGEPKEGRVTLRVRDLDYGVQFEVSDNGLGFPAHERHRLIEPYVTTRVKGSGLGLAIVARIIEDHGGLIELDDAPSPGHGAVVRFVLPKRWEASADAPADAGEGAVNGV
ncbi:MAG: PAS domain-containing sensor histidine kinase, partial [Caulobacterales bacterium]